MSALMSLPTEIICNITNHLDKSSTIFFAVVSKTAHDHVQMNFRGTSIGALAPALPAARVAELRHQHGNELGCINQWIITYLEGSNLSTSDWHAAYHSFQSLVAFEGCEVCEHVLFKYRLKEWMGTDWCLCPDRLKFYRRGNRRLHRCNNRSGCLAESWRTQVPRVVINIKQGFKEKLDQEPLECGKDSEVKVEGNQAQLEAEMSQTGITKEAGSMKPSAVTVRRSQRLIAATKGSLPSHTRKRTRI